MSSRVHYRDIVPYDVPASLDDLRGPADGSITLPRHIYWGPREDFDLENSALLRKAYRAIIREGSADEQVELLNLMLLKRCWNDLILPVVCRRKWEKRFPELGELRTGSMTSSPAKPAPHHEPIDHWPTVVLLLDSVGEYGFALAGAGALQAHGLSDRVTFDVDLFADPLITSETFADAVDEAEQALVDSNHTTVRLRQADMFTRLSVQTPEGVHIDVDFAVDWRSEDAVILRPGPVIAADDAIAGKLSALYYRGEIRDFIDVDRIRLQGARTDAQLWSIISSRDSNVDVCEFASRLAMVTHFATVEVSEYGYTHEEYSELQHRMLLWAKSLTTSSDLCADDLSAFAPHSASDHRSV